MLNVGKVLIEILKISLPDLLLNRLLFNILFGASISKSCRKKELVLAPSLVNVRCVGIGPFRARREIIPEQMKHAKRCAQDKASHFEIEKFRK